MSEEKDPKSVTGGGGEKTGGREAEATSGETLHDLEETQKVGGRGGAGAGDASAQTPSPDGEFDSGRGGAGDARRTGDPM